MRLLLFLFPTAEYSEDRTFSALGETLFCPGDDFILQLPAQVSEVIAVAGYPDDEIFILFRMSLGVPEGLPVYHIKLNMVVSLP